MKKMMIARNCALALMVAFGFTACDDDEDSEFPDVTLNVASAKLEYNSQNYWTDTYTNSTLTIDGFRFNHSGSTDPYDTWDGFTASRSTDNADDAGADKQEWIDYQWAAMPKGGLAGTGTPYLVAFYNEWAEGQSNQHSLKIARADGRDFEPLSVYLTNTAYAYWSMKKGDSFAHAFTKNDKFTVKIHGVKGAAETGVVEVVLADGTDILRTWKQCDLRSLGEVDYIYFTVTTTDVTTTPTGSWMNTPAYFALDRLEADL